MNYLKIGKATELTGRDRKIYRFFEIIPGFLSIFTILLLLILSYLKPVWVAYFIIAFDVYWLLLVIYMAIFLISSYRRLKQGVKINWGKKCEDLDSGIFPKDVQDKSLCRQKLSWKELTQLIFLPTCHEGLDIIRTSLEALKSDSFPQEKMVVILAMEERGGEAAQERAKVLKEEFGNSFGKFIITFHPDNIPGELKGKGANQAWAVKEVKAKYIDPEKMDYDKLLVSVFDIDTVIRKGYFFALSYKFLTVNDPYRASYQPVPVYHNNIWETPFFSRLAASSNTFWQMIMQIRQESLVTYSSHSMTFRALNDIGFWSTTMVSEDSRIFWHCLFHYKGDYRVEPLNHQVSMDITHDKTMGLTAKSLYKQQRRWAWGSENIPYLMFNMMKNWKSIDKKKFVGHLGIQIYGFHSWATNALIIAVVGWMPMLIGGDRFNSTVLSGNLPLVTQTLMNIAMVGLILSAVISSLLLPKRPKKYRVWKSVRMTLEWVFVPITIIFFGAIPCLDAQIRLMRGKYMGFWITPKSRQS